MTLKKIVFFVCCSLFSLVNNAQSDWEIMGEVSDENQQPLAQALVYVTPLDSSSNFLAFTNTDSNGIFSLKISTNFDTVSLLVRYLGYGVQQQKIVVNQTGYLKIQLKKEINALQEVVIAKERPAITKQSDTLVYDLDSFRDSTEYSVEDLIEKLPGIEVDENGSIKVNGKAIETVLVEGDDLLGRNYTLGTKNIRAEFIDRVEVIKRYQNNPVLKNVNLSDAVVLNLLMKEEKKNIISGTAHFGAGYGDEWKGMLHANLFSVARKHKVIVLTDNGNVGTHYGLRELEATYGNFDSDDLQAIAIETPQYVTPMDINNPGIRSEYIDNGINYFGTIRSVHQLGENWKIKANGILVKRMDEQVAFDSQRFLFDESSYSLQFSERLEISDNFQESDLSINYTDPDHKKSWYNYFKWQHTRKNSNNIFGEDANVNSLPFQTEIGRNQYDWQAASLLSHQLSTQSVGQLQLNMNSSNNSQALWTENDDFANFFHQPSSFYTLDQTLNYAHQTVETVGRLLSSSELVTMKLETGYGKYTAQLDNLIFLEDTSQNTISLFSEYDKTEELTQHKFWLHNSTLVNIASNASLRTSLTATSSNISFLEEDVRNLTWKGIAALKYFLKNGAKSEVQYQYESVNEALPYFFSVPYFSDNFTISMQQPRITPSSGHLISLGYKQEETLKFQSYFFQLFYRFAQQDWKEQVQFERSLQVVQPFFVKGMGRFTAIAKFDKFIPKIKTGVEVRPSLDIRQDQYLLEGIASDIRSRSFGVYLAFRTKFFDRINLHFNNTFRQIHIVNRQEQSTAQNTLLNWRTDIDLHIRQKDWLFALILNYNYSTLTNSTVGGAKLLGANIEISKQAELWGKPISYILQIFNPLQIQEYSNTYSSEFWAYRSTVEAIRPYFLLSIDTSF